MSKALTLSDLAEALKPINLALKQMKEERTQNDTQLSEIHNMAVETSTKLDLFNGHFASIIASLAAQPAPKKLVGRKGSTKKAPAKKATKKGKKGGDDDEPKEASEAEDKDEDAPEAEDKDEDTPEAEDKDEDAPEAEESGSKKKKVVKKAPAKKVVKKEPVKKTTKAAKKKEPAKKPAKLNKMQYFKKVFEEDSSTFDKYLTARVKKAVDAENKEKFDALEGANLQKAKVNAYYTYFRDNHGDELDKMRDAYVAENAEGDDADGGDDAEAADE